MCTPGTWADASLLPGSGLRAGAAVVGEGEPQIWISKCGLSLLSRPDTTGMSIHAHLILGEESGVNLAGDIQQGVAKAQEYSLKTRHYCDLTDEG